MKALIAAAIIGFALGIWASVETSSKWGFPCHTKTIHDTITVADTIVKTDTIYECSASYDLPADSVAVDTISTMVNGKIVNYRYRIKIK